LSSNVLERPSAEEALFWKNLSGFLKSFAKKTFRGAVNGHSEQADGRLLSRMTKNQPKRQAFLLISS